MVLFVKSDTNCMAALCPSGADKHEAENILKTKDWKRRFSKNEAENVLKTSQLTKHVGKQNYGDKLLSQGERCAGRIRFGSTCFTQANLGGAWDIKS
jgi:hypothetical protein